MSSISHWLERSIQIEANADKQTRTVLHTDVFTHCAGKSRYTFTSRFQTPGAHLLIVQGALPVTPKIVDISFDVLGFGLAPGHIAFENQAKTLHHSSHFQAQGMESYAMLGCLNLFESHQLDPSKAHGTKSGQELTKNRLDCLTHQRCLI